VRPLAVDHVAINVADVGEAIAFYTEVLGLRLRDDRPDLGLPGAWMDAGGQQVHLLEAPVAANVGQHFSLLVDSLDETVAELRRRGVQISDPGRVGRDKQAFLLDPSGNALELHERGG
jgi:glyoxylase I family protein